MAAKKAVKPSSPPPVEKSAIEKYPDFTNDILELLGKLPANVFIDSVLTILEEVSIPKDFEKEVIARMELLNAPAPKEVVDFLFNGLGAENFDSDDSYINAILTLASITDKKDKVRLIQTTVSYLRDKAENSGQLEVLNALQDLTSELK